MSERGSRAGGLAKALALGGALALAAIGCQGGAEARPSPAAAIERGPAESGAAPHATNRAALGSGGPVPALRRPAGDEIRIRAVEAERAKAARIRRLLVAISRSTPDAIPPFIGELSTVPDIRVVQALRFFVTEYSTPGIPMMTQQVRLSAAKGLGLQSTPDDPRVGQAAVEALVAATKERWNSRERKGDGVVRLSIQSLGDLGLETALPHLRRLVGNGRGYWAFAALPAIERIEILSAIDALLAALLRADREFARAEAGTRARKNWTLEREEIRRNLARATGQDLGSVGEWREWWTSNRSSFRN